MNYEKYRGVYAMCPHCCGTYITETCPCPDKKEIPKMTYEELDSMKAKWGMNICAAEAIKNEANI